MSCERNLSLLSRVTRRLGISGEVSKSAALASSAPQVSFFKQPRARSKRSGKRTKKPSSKQIAGSTGSGQRSNEQTSFFDVSQKEPASAPASLPTQRQVKLPPAFSDEELQSLSVQLRLGEAAAARRLRELNSGVERGIGWSDPRPDDWARADQKNYHFLVSALDGARRGEGYLDTTGLKSDEMADLWEFARFEADRALRNIDHLNAGLSHLKGPTADYLVSRHKLEARFFTCLAAQLETVIPRQEIEAIKAWD